MTTKPKSRTSSKSATSMKLKQKKAKGQEGRDEKTGQFTPGNRFWEARSSHGRHPIFESADQLQDACLQYYRWIDENPLYEAKAFAHQGTVTLANLPKMRAMTLAGLCLFIGISRETWNEWRGSRPDLSDVIREAEEVIYSQKFAGAAADLLNANIIARDLGLADKNELSGKDGGPIETTNVSTRELATSVMDLLREAKLEKGENA